MPDMIRTSWSHALRHLQGIGGFLAAVIGILGAAAPLPAGAAEPPPLALHELVLSAQDSIDRHQLAFLAVVVGVMLFAVVIAALLVRTRARAALRHMPWAEPVNEDTKQLPAPMRAKPAGA